MTTRPPGHRPGGRVVVTPAVIHTKCDFAGEIVPATVLYGAQTERAVEAFIIGALRMPRDRLARRCLTGIRGAERRTLRVRQLRRAPSDRAHEATLDSFVRLGEGCGRTAGPARHRRQRPHPSKEFLKA
jgi:hypothetical protein